MFPDSSRGFPSEYFFENGWPLFRSACLSSASWNSVFDFGPERSGCAIGMSVADVNMLLEGSFDFAVAAAAARLSFRLLGILSPAILISCIGSVAKC